MFFLAAASTACGRKECATQADCDSDQVCDPLKLRCVNAYNFAGGNVADGGQADATSTDTGPGLDALTADTGAADAGVDGGADTGPRPDSGCPATYGAFSGTKPLCTIEVSFSIDDSANRVYGATDGLAWKGSLDFDSSSRILTRDPSWGGGTGPYPLLYDDGPWTAGGHEARTATASDNIWSVATFFVPGEEATDFEYGAVRLWEPGEQGEWIWSGSNGTFSVPGNATEDVAAPGLVLPAFGSIDLRLTINTSSLAAEFADFDVTRGVRVKSSGWGWSLVDCGDLGQNGDLASGDGIFTFVMRENIGRGNALPYSGLFASGARAEFVFELGGVEYKVGGAASAIGVRAELQLPKGPWGPLEIAVDPVSNNTFVVFP